MSSLRDFSDFIFLFCYNHFIPSGFYIGYRYTRHSSEELSVVNSLQNYAICLLHATAKILRVKLFIRRLLRVCAIGKFLLFFRVTRKKRAALVWGQPLL